MIQASFFFQLDSCTVRTEEVIRDHLSHLQMTYEANEAKRGVGLAKVIQRVSESSSRYPDTMNRCHIQNHSHTVD